MTEVGYFQTPGAGGGNQLGHPSTCPSGGELRRRLVTREILCDVVEKLRCVNRALGRIKRAVGGRADGVTSQASQLLQRCILGSRHGPNK